MVDLGDLGLEIDNVPTPNYIPRNSGEVRIAFISDYPASKNSKNPLGASQYSFLFRLAKEAGVNLNECFIGNILDVYPPSGNFQALGWEHQVTLAGLAKLRTDLLSFKPTILVGLGPLALEFLKDRPSNFDDERGSPFLSKFGGQLALVTYHPNQLFRQFHYSKVAVHDIEKAKRLGKPGAWKLPKLNLNYQPSFDEVMSFLTYVLQVKCWLSVDVETNMSTNKITCISLATNTTDAICIPFAKQGTKSYWTFEQEVQIWKLLARVLENNPLIGQNAVHFDHTILGKEHGILANFASDTMYAHWECYCELPKSIAFQSSLYTDNPFYKNVLRDARSGRLPYWEEYRYCCYDTLNVNQNARKISEEFKDMPPSVREHYRFNIRTSRVYQYMSFRGVPFDKTKRDQRVKELQEQNEVLQKKLNAATGLSLNVRSAPQMRKWIYEDLKIAKRYKTVFNKKTGESEDRLTTDYLTLLYIARENPHIEALSIAAKQRKLLKRISSLKAIETDERGYISWAFNGVGTLTGRSSGYKPYNGKGVQPQNVDRRDRDLALAGPGNFWLKADLEGADSWTVAACLYKLGSATMLDDLLAGIKPAQVIAISRMFGEHLATADRDELKKYIPRLKEGSIEEAGTGKAEYFIAKPVAHGSAYGMRGNTMHKNIFKQSQGEVYVPPHVCDKAQEILFRRYPLPLWHDFMFNQLKSKGYLDTAAGTRRVFFGRPDNTTLREFLSHMPQCNTAYTANMLLHRLFYEHENRRGLNRLYLEPVNQVHDEIDAIFEQQFLDRVREIFWSKCTTELDVWGVKVKIPFEAAYGEDWGSCRTELEPL